MPEFEEPAIPANSKQNYTPSTDASTKPRTRRRSGGFKTEVAMTNTHIGEVDPVQALKEEKLSGSAKAESSPAKETSPTRVKKAEFKRERPAPSAGKAQPSPETLAAIQRVEARLEERRKERDARRGDKSNSRPARSDKPSPRSSTNSRKKPASGGLMASILGFFGLGPKQPAKKPGAKSPSSENRGSEGPGRRSGPGGNRSGPGQNRRGGKGRRSGGSGGNRPRRNGNRNEETQS